VNQPDPRGTPFFSVLIPSYNRPEFLGAAVESVLASNFEDYEVIISDDCSPRQEEIEAILDKHLSDPRVSFVPQPVNLREPANRAFLYRAARGDWHLALSDDDKLYPQALNVLAGAIKSHPDVDLFTFGYTVIDEHDRSNFSRRSPKLLKVNRDHTKVLREFLVSDAFPYWFYQPATFCSHRTVATRIQPNSNIGIGDDLQFLFDYVNAGCTILVVPEILMYYRKMNPRATHLQLNQSSGRLASFESRYRILLDLLQRPDVCPEIRTIVDDPGFRRRFAYKSIASEKIQPQRVVKEIQMQKQHGDELIRYYRLRSRRLVRTWGYVARCGFFLRFFGWAGLGEIVRVFTQRCWSRLRRIRQPTGI
jgi:glycosyltransferase involved in cell wall biosynthesis